MKSPLNYLGGKSRLADRIVTMIPSDHTCYCEAFCGAGWVLFAKEPSECEVINDMDDELITFWRVIQNHLEEFLRYFKFAVISRRVFELQNMTHPETLTDIQKAVRYYYLQRLGFGGKVHKRTFGTSTSGGPRLDISSISERLLEVHWRLQKVCIERLDANDCIRRYDRPTTVFYLDPPYWKTAGYAIPFKTENYHQLRDTLKKVQGRFLLSLNDTPEVREIYKDFRIIKVATTYSSANPHGSSKHGRGEPRAEVIIHNL